MPGDNWAVTAASTRRAKKERALLSKCRRCRRVLRRNFSRRECPSRRLGESASTLRAFPNSGPRGRSWPRRRSCERQRHAHHPDPTARAHRPAATALYELFRWPARRLRFAPVRLLVRTSPRQICHPARCSSRNERLADSLAAAPGRRQKIRGSHVVALALAQAVAHDRAQEALDGAVIEDVGRRAFFELEVHRHAVSLVGPDEVAGRAFGPVSGQPVMCLSLRSGRRGRS